MLYEVASKSECVAVIDGTTSTAAIDVAGCTGILIAYGGTGTVSVTESDSSSSGYAAVDSGDLISGNGTIGYQGNKRYIKVVGSAATVFGVVVKTGCRYCPTESS